MSVEGLDPVVGRICAEALSFAIEEGVTQYAVARLLRRLAMKSGLCANLPESFRRLLTAAAEELNR